jgi:hypothetical protein
VPEALPPGVSGNPEVLVSGTPFTSILVIVPANKLFVILTITLGVGVIVGVGVGVRVGVAVILVVGV